MKRFRRIALSLMLAITLMAVLAVPAAATNPTVSITVTAEVVSITNTMDTWAIGTVAVNDVVYFSATGAEDDDYSTITNTGSVAVDVEIQGTDFEGGDYDWTLAASSGNQTYSLYANNTTGGPNYAIEVKSSEPYNDLVTDLAVSGTYDWSMKFTAPTAFNPSDDGNEKSATVTLVASKHE